MKAKDLAQQKEKEGVLKELANILNSSGFRVRREKLKQGHGWRAVSGTCRVLADKLIFLDRRLPQDEQIEFLVDRISASGIVVSNECRGVLPESIFNRVAGVPAESAPA